MTGRWFLLSCGGLVVVRATLGAHAPAAVDAHACLAALALALVAQAPRAALGIAGLVTASAVLSIPTSWDPWVSVLALPSLLGPLAMFLLAASGSCRLALLTGVIAGGALHGAAALVQRFYTWPDAVRRMDELGLHQAAVERLAEQRPLGLSVSPDLASGLCAAGVFAALCLALEVHDRRARIAAGMAALLSLGGILVCRSFGTTLALAAGGTLAGVLMMLRHNRTGRTLALGAVLVGLISLGATVALRGPDAWMRSAGERLENWHAALVIFADAPLFGVGFMRFPAAYLVARTPEANLTRYAHSAPLQLLAEAGIVGGLCVAAAVVWWVLLVIRRHRQSAFTPSDLVLLGGATAAAARMVFDYDAQIAQVAAGAAVLWGLLVAGNSPGPAELLQRRILAPCAAVALCLVAILGWRERVLDAARQDGAGDVIVRYHDLLPFDVESGLALAKHRLDTLGACTNEQACAEAHADALHVLHKLCARRHPPAAAYLLRARAHLVSQDAARALDDADAALRLDPGNETGHLIGLLAARALGQDTRSREEDAARWGITPPT